MQSLLVICVLGMVAPLVNSRELRSFLFNFNDIVLLEECIDEPVSSLTFQSGFCSSYQSFCGPLFGKFGRAPYIKPCRKSDPKLNECAKKHANEAIPFLIEGDKTYKIPSFMPAIISLVDVDQGDLKFKLKNLSLTGLNTTHIEDVKLDLVNKHFYFKVFIPETKIDCRYEMNGKIASFAIEGDGPAEIISTNITVEYFFDYNLIQKKDGKQYMDTNNLKSNLTTVIEKRHLKLGNLFGGNKVLGDNFNNFLNENTKEVEESAGMSNREIINAIVSTICQGIFKTVSLDEMFLD